MKKYSTILFFIVFYSTNVSAELGMGPQFPPSLYPEYSKRTQPNSQTHRARTQTNLPKNKLAAAQRGDVKAQVAVALEYLTGSNRNIDEAKAFRWLSIAEQNGSTEASAYLATMHYYGKATPQNYDEAFTLFTKAAESGNPIAQFNLHVMYTVGYGVSVNKKKALTWLMKAAKNGLPVAETKLGMLYKSGGMIKRNLKKSTYWLRRAASKGEPEGQIQLAKNYAMGIGAKQNFFISYIWFNIAEENCKQGIEFQQCQDFKTSIASTLSPEDIYRAEQEATRKRNTIAQNHNILAVEKVIIH